ncbi:MAG: hypothetical protein M0C28_21125 [Candidatus Moduliflexus flocculans]|nr:hypothetical protein [Candidatus Moduliflexus flocculans]
MADWLERAAGPGGITLSLVYLELVLAVTLLTSVLHFQRLKEARGELGAVRLYFLAVFGLFLVLPCALTFLTSARPFETLAGFGWTFGRVGLGLRLTLALLPVACLAGFSGARDPGLRRMYPFAKEACSGTGRFVGYEASYVFSIICHGNPSSGASCSSRSCPAIGLIPALAVQTGAVTLMHIGHPDKEIFSAALSGPAFGLGAYVTGSFFYPLVIHAAVGVITDSLACRRLRRGKA